MQETGDFYNFTNIRYAAPPLGANRFRAPQPPAENRSIVEDGAQGRICPQANPQWSQISRQFVALNLTGQPNNQTQANLDRVNASLTPATLPALDPRTTEDCLFLDVVVPKSVYDGREGAGAKGAPVLVWIYGGGYTAGAKSTYNPPGLIYRSEQGGREPVIFVAMNYRLGAFGWLAGPSFQQDGTANNGLLDQRAALEWVQTNIHLFGGNKDRVTVFGESAGGGSISHHITAYAGNDHPPFQQAVPQSPGFQPLVSNLQNDNIFAEFLRLANVTTIEELRSLPTEQLIAANQLQVGRSQYGQFTYGPAVDGSYVPQLPGQLLLQGNFNKGIKVMTGKNVNEGQSFTNPFVQGEDNVRAFLLRAIPTASSQALDYLQTTLYPPPPVSNGTFSYTTDFDRLRILISEANFQCNAVYLDTAFSELDQAYGYYFEVPPGTHGQDIAYTFYNNGNADPARLLLNTTVAVALQDYITTFAQTGVPSAPDVQGVPEFRLYGPDSQVQDLQQASISSLTDPQQTYRCQWWQKALYL